MAALNYYSRLAMVRPGETGYTELEKRQLFLRSYQFSRKQSLSERIKKSLYRAKKVIWGRFRSARKLRRMLWLRLRNGVLFTAGGRRRRFFLRLQGTHYFHAPSPGPSWNSSCNFW